MVSFSAAILCWVLLLAYHRPSEHRRAALWCAGQEMLELRAQVGAPPTCPVMHSRMYTLQGSRSWVWLQMVQSDVQRQYLERYMPEKKEIDAQAAPTFKLIDPHQG